MYFDELKVGTVWEVGEATYELEEMVAFAKRYDPEPFHVDEEWSRNGPFGEIISSGLLTLGKMRYLDQLASTRLGLRNLVAAELKSIKFPRPARAGDTVRFYKECLAKRASRSNNKRGLVTFQTTGLNQHDQTLVESTAVVVYERRPPANV
ncbi:MAG: hypothetical protein HOI95_20400 [Chromatiales bacterium]|jgi:acyl dehydratase|nr:hypothetical protein [Chromatiales bacterium]